MSDKLEANNLNDVSYTEPSKKVIKILYIERFSKILSLINSDFNLIRNGPYFWLYAV